MTPENLKESWLNRETQFSAFTNGPLLDFWQHREESQFVGLMISPFTMSVLFIKAS